MKVYFYTTLWSIGEIVSYDFYFLPMFRYLHHGKKDQWLQFRWLMFGINLHWH